MRFPVAIRDPALLADLLAWSAKERAAAPGAALGVMGARGWAGLKVGPGSPLWRPCIAQLVAALRAACPQLMDCYTWQAWPVVLEPGGFIGWHDHHQAKWAAVLFLHGQGDLVFEDGARLAPQPGRGVVFPGTLAHAVPAVTGGERVSVACNFYGFTQLESRAK